MKRKKWVLRRLRILLSVFVSAAVLAPAAPFRAAAMEDGSGTSVRKANQVVLDDGPEATQTPPLEKTVPVNNAVVPDEEENTELDTVVATKNIVTEDEGEPEPDILDETVPLSDMVVPLEGEEMPSDYPDNPFLDILVPGDISFILDPYNILGQGTVISDEYVFENKSGIDILVNLKSFEYIPPDGEETGKTKTADSDEEMDLRFTSSNLNLVDYEQWLALFPEEEPESGSQPQEGEEVPEGEKPEQQEEAPEPETKPETDLPETAGELQESGEMDAPDAESAEGMMDSVEPASSGLKPEEGVADPVGMEPEGGPMESDSPQSGKAGLWEEPMASAEPEPSAGPASQEEKETGGDEMPEEAALFYRHSRKNEIAIKKDGSSPLVFALMGDEEEGANRAVFRIKGTADPDSELAIAEGGRVRLVFSCMPFDGSLTDVKETPEPEPDEGNLEKEEETKPSPDGTETVPTVPPESEPGSGTMEEGPSPTPDTEEQKGGGEEETGAPPESEPDDRTPAPVLPEESAAPPDGGVDMEEPETPSASGAAIQT